MQIVFATNNAHKLREIRDLLGDSFNLMSLSDIGIADDIPENETSLEGNALQKARYIHRILNMDVFADDTGLEIEALNGLPGVNSARFAGDNKDSEANIDKVLGMMVRETNRKARFRTVIALIMNNREYIFEGAVDGQIIHERKGKEGFGYDPVFMPDGFDVSFAEMPLSRKNIISHRARAFRKLKEFILQNENQNNKETKQLF